MKKFIIVILLGVFVFTFSNTRSSAYTIPKEAIRLRVVANSDSTYDQAMKKKVSQMVQSRMYELLKDTKGVESARKIIYEHLEEIDQDVAKVLINNHYNIDYTIHFGQNHFPEKEYNGVLYEEGEYESLLITIGRGEGKNWWCVLFPPLCLMEAEETNSSKVEYKSFIQELIDKYL